MMNENYGEFRYFVFLSSKLKRKPGWGFGRDTDELYSIKKYQKMNVFIGTRVEISNSILEWLTFRFWKLKNVQM